MKINKFSQFLRRASAVVALAFASSFAYQADAALHVAFGVDTSTIAATYNQLRVSDLHGDHYHSFTGNNGVPGSHVPEPFTVIPSSSVATLDLASMDISPYASSRYTTNLPGNFHLELVSLSGIDADNLIVRFWHGDHTHTMSAGSEEHLSLTEINRIDFALPEGAAFGNYSAVFRIIDEENLYGDSPNFTINVQAVPEPSSALIGAAALAFGIARRNRR